MNLPGEPKTLREAQLLQSYNALTQEEAYYWKIEKLDREQLLTLIECIHEDDPALVMQHLDQFNDYFLERWFDEM